MDSTVKRILGLNEHEDEGGKLHQEAVVYLKPDQIGDDSGAHCGACIFFNAERSECLLTSPPACDSENGVCAAFLGGKSIFKAAGTPLKLIPKKDAGYIEDGPTKCVLCEYYTGRGKEKTGTPAGEEGTCKKVSGTIFAGGCCNLFELC